MLIKQAALKLGDEASIHSQDLRPKQQQVYLVRTDTVSQNLAVFFKLVECYMPSLYSP